MNLTTWLTFFLAAWAISLSPGAGAVASMSAGLNHGFKRGYVLCLGLVLGIWTQLLVVAVGLGALVAASSTAFALIKWAGVAYLVWLGLAQWRAASAPLAVSTGSEPAASPWQLVLRGWGVNTVNPKGTVFLLAVVPQFLDLGQPLWPQYLVIGATLAFTDLVVMAGYTALAAKVLATLQSAAHMRLLNRLFGALFVMAGLGLAAFKPAA
jgi:homoserine/homoserine lactone efflux protein